MAVINKVKINNGENIDIHDIRLPSVTTTDDGKVLIVENGVWVAQTLSTQTYYSGNNTPPNSLGENGDLYLQTN